MSTLSWQAGSASGSFLTGTIIQGLITVNDPNYNPTNWQGTLLVFAMVLIIYIANIWGAKSLPMIQNLLLVVHIFGFLVIVIVLWVLAPRQSAKNVFTQFTNGGGWSSMGVSLMIGQISAIYGSICTSCESFIDCVVTLLKVLIGSDCTAHMAEEVKDAGRNVPNAMVWSYVLNGFMGLIIVITYLFCMPSVTDALDDPSTFPFIYVFRNAVSIGGVNGLTIVLLILVIASNIAFNASTARQTFAFARDKGLPFASWIGRVHPTLHIPANAVAVSCIITLLLSLINIGSVAAFNAIISLQVCALMFTYSISISCVLYRRIKHPEFLPHARWSLGRMGVPINIFGICYVVFAFFWSFWPNATPIDASSFNYSVVLFMAVLIISFIMYYVQGRKIYEGPVMSVEGRGRDE